jgi:hypothetical protein
MCSSAVHEAGGLTSAIREIRNEKNKSNMDARQRTPGDFAISDPEASYDEASP